MITQIKDKVLIMNFGKAHDLTFCPKYLYCESGPYNNDIGKNIPSYMDYKGKLYTLKYHDGCFNPYLYVVTGAIAHDKVTYKPLFPVEKWFKNELNRFTVIGH